jgi:hypothetical protein
MKLMRIGVDLAKNVFQIHGVDSHEKPVWRQRLPRDRWLQTVLEKIEPVCEVGMDLPVFKKTQGCTWTQRPSQALRVTGEGMRRKWCHRSRARSPPLPCHLRAEPDICPILGE